MNANFLDILGVVFGWVYVGASTIFLYRDINKGSMLIVITLGCLLIWLNLQ